MQRRQFLASSLLVLAAGCQGLRPPARTIRVLSYNIHHGEGVDGRLDLPRLARIVSGSGADLVALQEVDQRAQRTGGVDQAEELGRLTGFHAGFGPAMDFQGGAYGQALLSRWPLKEFAVHPLPNPSGREPRIAVSARVQPPGWPVIRFAATHLDHVRDDGDRWEQAARLLEVFGAGAEPTVLAGDFNATPDSRVMTSLLARWRDAAADDPQPTIPAEAPRSRIDYVLLSPAAPWRVDRASVLAEAAASDHRPVLVELAWQP